VIPEPNQFVTVVDEFDRFGAAQVVIATLVNWLRTHRQLDAICKELVSIGSKSCNLSHRSSPRIPSVHAGWRGCSEPTW